LNILSQFAASLSSETTQGRDVLESPDYVLMLLRCYRPGFDDLPSKERANLVDDTCAHSNAFLEALRKP
jgi:hypothetical protein